MPTIYVLTNPPVKGQSWTYTGFPMFDSQGDFVAVPGFAPGDVQISKDGANPVNIASLPTPFGSTGMLTWTFTAGEMNCKNLTVICHSAGGSFADCSFTIDTMEAVEIECGDGGGDGCCSNRKRYTG